MARLEIEIAGNNAALLKAIRESKDALKGFNQQVGKFPKLAQTSKETSRALDQQAIALAKSKTETQKARQALAELSLENRKNKPNIQAAAGSYREAQQRLKELGKAIREASNGFNSNNPAVQANIRQYRDLNNQLKAFDKQMGLNFRNVGNYPQLLGAINPQLGMMATRLGAVGAVAGLFGNAYKVMAAFDSGLLNVAKTTGLAGDELNKLSGDIISLSRRLEVVSTAKLTEYATVAGQLGVKGRQNIINFTEALAQLETASNITGEEGGAEIARTLTLIDGGVQNVKRFGDEIVNLGNNFAATEKEILSNAEAIAQNTAIYGFSRQQVLGYAAATKSLGLEAEVVGSAFQKTLGIFEKAILTGNGLDNILKVTGGSAAELRKEFATNASGVFQQYVQGLNRIRQAGGSVAAQLTQNGIVDIRNRRVIQTLASSYDTLDRAMITVKDSAGAMAAEFDQASTKLSNQVQRIKIAFDNLILSIDDGRGAFGRFVAGVAGGLADILSGMTDIVSSNSWKEFFLRIGQLSGNSFAGAASKIAGDIAKAQKEIADGTITPGDGNWIVQYKDMKDFYRLARSEQEKYAKKQADLVKLNAKAYNDDKSAKNLETLQYNTQKLAKIYQSIYKDAEEGGKKVANAVSGGLSGDAKSGGVKVDYLSKLKEVAAGGLFSAQNTENEGLAKVTARTQEEYRKLIKSVDDIEKQGLAANKKNAAERTKISEQAAKDRASLITSRDAKIAEQTRQYEENTTEVIRRETERAGIVRESSRQRDLQQSDAYYNELRAKYKENEQIINQITEFERAARDQINQKWNNKSLTEFGKLRDKIAKIEQQNFPQTLRGDRLQKEMDKRLAQIDKYYKDIAKVMGIGLPAWAITGMRAFSRASVQGNAPDPNEITNRLRNQIGRAGFAALDQVAGSLTSIGQKNYEIEQKYQELREGKTAEQIVQLNRLMRIEKQVATGLGNTLSALFNSVSSGIGGVIKTRLTEDLGSILSGEAGKVSFKDFATKNKNELYALGGQLVGSLVAGMSKPTSTGGQAIGGALSGAAAGLGIGAAFGAKGGPIGAAIGGFVGLLSGIFSSSAARKQERLMQEQLAEQRKQTAIQQRQLQLGFTASIIGQRTNQGVITGVDRNAFGDIEFILEGRTLKATLDQEEKFKARGM